MNKKTLIIIGVIIGLLIIGMTVFLFTRPEGAGKAGQGMLSFLFPSPENKPGPSLPPTDIGDGSTQGQTPTAPGQPQKTLTQLTTGAVAGAAWNNTLKKVRYFEKNTGHLYQINPNGQNKEQLSITTIPRIFSVTWLKDANGAVLRYFDTSGKTNFSQTFLAYSLATSSKELAGVFLAANTRDVAISPTEEKIFYLAGDDSVSGVTASYKNKDQKQIFSSPYANFSATWLKKDAILLATRPTASIDGYLYQLDVKTGNLSKILGPVKGLTALASPSLKTILFSQSEHEALIAKIYDAAKKTTAVLAIKTLPEKCIFSPVSTTTLYCAAPKILPGAEYPDDWYKGNISFTDALWRINLEKGTTDLILNENDFDATNLFMSAEENYLFFQNKKDGALWSLKLAD